MYLSIHHNAARRATTWYANDAALNVAEPEFRRNFEKMFNCAIIWEGDIPAHLRFFTDADYAWFLLRWQ